MSDFDTKDISFSIIKHRGDPTSATTLDGIKVSKEESLFVPEWGTSVKAADYGNHFLYLDNSKKIGRWWAMCTCGAPAVIVGYDAYKHDASKGGALVVCKDHAGTGRHADGAQ